MRCSAHRRDGSQCGSWAVKGANVCRMHGGAAPAVRAAASRRLAEVEAVREVEGRVLTRAPMTLRDVYDELLRTAALAVEWRNLAEAKVAELSSWRYTASSSGAEQLRAEVALFERAMDRAAKVAEMITRLDLDARVSGLTRRDGQILAGVIEAVLTGLDLDEQRREKARQIVADAIREHIGAHGS